MKNLIVVAGILALGLGGLASTLMSCRPAANDNRSCGVIARIIVGRDLAIEDLSICFQPARILGFNRHPVDARGNFELNHLDPGEYEYYVLDSSGFEVTERRLVTLSKGEVTDLGDIVTRSSRHEYVFDVRSREGLEIGDVWIGRVEEETGEHGKHSRRYDGGRARFRSDEPRLTLTFENEFFRRETRKVLPGTTKVILEKAPLVRLKLVGDVPDLPRGFYIIPKFPENYLRFSGLRSSRFKEDLTLGMRLTREGEHSFVVSVLCVDERSPGRAEMLPGRIGHLSFVAPESPMEIIEVGVSDGFRGAVEDAIESLREPKR